jgi:hypothetical protein
MILWAQAVAHFHRSTLALTHTLVAGQETPALAAQT